MRWVLNTLLCVGVQLIWTSGVHGLLPRPHIQFVPGSLILRGESVTIQCSGPPWAENYRISKKVSEVGEKTQMMNKRTLTIPQMTSQQAGLYDCSYQRGDIWSSSSQLLPLVMTGAYDKPSLFAAPGPMLSPRQNVRLDCVSSVKFEMFYFIQEGGVHTSQSADLTPGATGSQASFHVDMFTHIQAGPYRCFGGLQNFSYVWSHPSDPLSLQVIDAPFTAPSGQSAWPTEAWDPQLNTEHPTHPADSPSNLTGSAVVSHVENAVRLALAALVLLVLLAVLLEAWFSQKSPIRAPYEDEDPNSHLSHQHGTLEP